MRIKHWPTISCFYSSLRASSDQCLRSLEVFHERILLSPSPYPIPNLSQRLNQLPGRQSGCEWCRPGLPAKVNATRFLPHNQVDDNDATSATSLPPETT